MLGFWGFGGYYNIRCRIISSYLFTQVRLFCRFHIVNKTIHMQAHWLIHICVHAGILAHTHVVNVGDAHKR